MYVDGGNLYFGLARRVGVKWLDLVALAQKLVNADHEIVKVVYFASRVIDKSEDHHKSARQDKYFVACAEAADCDWFFTTDAGILKKARGIAGIRVANPVEFVGEV